MEQVCTHLYGLVVVDSKGRIVFVEEEYAKFKGWKMEDIVGRYIKDIVPTSQFSKQENQFWAIYFIVKVSL